MFKRNAGLALTSVLAAAALALPGTASITEGPGSTAS